MSKNTQKESSEKMTITVPGHEVTLYFAAEPSSQVALQVKQVLLGKTGLGEHDISSKMLVLTLGCAEIRSHFLIGHINVLWVLTHHTYSPFGDFV